MLNYFSSIAPKEKVISALVRLPQSLTANERELGFEVYPNPTTGRFTIEFNESQLGEEDVVVELRALVGNILEQHHLTSTNGYLKKELDLDQHAGIYLIIACSKNGCITQKLMIAQ